MATRGDDQDGHGDARRPARLGRRVGSRKAAAGRRVTAAVASSGGGPPAPRFGRARCEVLASVPGGCGSRSVGSRISTMRPRPCRLGAWAIGLIHYAESPRCVEPAEAVRDLRRLPAQVRGRRGVRQPRARRGRQGGRGRGADDGPAERRRGALVLRRGGAADGGEGDQGGPRLERRRHPRRRGLSAPTSISSTGARRGSGAGPARASTGACCASGAPRSRRSSPAACAPRTSPRRSPSPIPMRSTSPAGSRPSRAARTTPR